MIVLAHVAWRLSSLQLCTFLHWFRECVQHATFESQCRCHQLSRVAEIQAQHRIRQSIGLEDFAEVTKYLKTQLSCARELRDARATELMISYEATVLENDHGTLTSTLT